MVPKTRSLGPLNRLVTQEVSGGGVRVACRYGGKSGAQTLPTSGAQLYITRIRLEQSRTKHASNYASEEH